MIKYTLVIILSLVCWHVSAQDVNVSNRGPVNVNNGHFVGYQFNQSSIVKQIYYDKANEYLLVNLDGAFYHHCAVPSDIVNVWVGMSSVDRYYNEYVKGKYDCQINPMPEYR